MPGTTSLLQLIVVGMGLLWLVSLLAIWVRYDEFRHGALLLSAIVLWPTLIIESFIRAYGLQVQLAFLFGLFNFTPVFLITLLYYCVHKLVIEKALSSTMVYLVPALLIFCAQVPLLILPMDVKTQILLHPPVGNLPIFWPLYGLFAVSGFMLLVMAIKIEELLANYQHHLSDHVVDINFYKFPVAISMFGALIVVAFFSIIFTALVAFDVVAMSYWQDIINLLQAAIMLVLLLILLARRRYAPSPLNYEGFDKHTYSNEYLRDTLTKAEQAIIKSKAYKKIGLRLGQLAHAAKVEPQALAIATRTILNRNFRAFIYHYRLEYAKKVLMRTDAKVAAVAKRLGFNSEKFLSGIFVKYIEKMGKEGKQESVGDFGNP
jgi:AraC-like DNA-binding protein